MRRGVPFVSTLILLSILSDGYAQRQLPGPDDLVTQVNEPRTFQDLPYRLMKPIDLADHPGKAYPLVLSLHGSNGRGLTNRGNLESWNRVMAEEEWRRDYPCFVVASQTQFEWFEPGMVPDLTARWFHTNPRGDVDGWVRLVLDEAEPRPRGRTERLKGKKSLSHAPRFGQDTRILVANYSRIYL